jgi:hypothetical protein
MFTEFAKWAVSGRTMAALSIVYEEVLSCENKLILILRRRWNFYYSKGYML